MSGTHHTGQNVPHLRFVKVRFQMVAVTLRMKPRSNRGYVMKGLVKGNSFPISLHWKGELWPISQRSKVTVT